MIDMIGFHVMLRTCRPAILTVALILALIGSSMTPGWAAGDAEETDNSGIPEHYYVELDHITVTLFDEGSVVGLYTVAATLEIAEADQRNLVLAGRARLRDAMIVELHKLVARRKGVTIPLDAVKFRLRDVAQRTLGKDVVIDLFVENVLRKDT